MKSNLHNELAGRYLGEVVRKTDSMPEMMVVIETLLLGTMKVLEHRYNLDRKLAAELVETAMTAAIERNKP